MTIDEQTKAIYKFSAFSEADIRGEIIALENVIIEELLNGRIILFDKLGSFYTSLSSEGSPTADEFTTALIRGAKVNYRPGIRINNALKDAKFSKFKV